MNFSAVIIYRSFKHEEDVDRFLAHMEEEFPNIPTHSLEAERKLEEKAQWLAQKQKAVNMRIRSC